jgi:hypothetical protein
MNAKDTIAHIATLGTAAEVEALLAEETRASVVAAAQARLQVLQAEQPATEEAQATEEATPATEEAQAAEEAATDTDEQELPVSPEPIADVPAPAHVVKGKGASKPAAASAAPASGFVVMAPDAKGLVGCDGKLYTRAQIAASPKLQARLYALGSRVVRRIK